MRETSWAKSPSFFLFFLFIMKKWRCLCRCWWWWDDVFPIRWISYGAFFLLSFYISSSLNESTICVSMCNWLLFLRRFCLWGDIVWQSSNIYRWAETIRWWYGNAFATQETFMNNIWNELCARSLVMSWVRTAKRVQENQRFTVSAFKTVLENIACLQSR